MTDTKANAHRRGPSSFIPIAMPLMQARTSFSLQPQNSNANKSGSIPDSYSAPHLSSQSRSFSVGHYPSPQTSPNSKTTSTPSNSNAGQPQPQQQSTPVLAGRTTFRSFRNLLPFGPGKAPASPNTSSSSILTPKRSFSLGQRPAKEKEKGGDKKSRSPIPSVPDLPDLQKPPILIVQNATLPWETGVTTTSLPPQLPPLQLQSEAPKPAPLISITLPFPTSASTTSSVSPSPSRTDHDTPPLSSPSKSQISDATDNPCHGDLSTIIESETSVLSISKHIPTLYEEDLVDGQLGGEHKDIDNSIHPPSNGLHDRVQVGDPGTTSSRPTPGSPTASTTLELSTSQLAEIAAEVRNAMSAGDGQNGAWLGSVIVEEASEPKIDIEAEHDGDNGEDPNRLGVGLGLGDVSFNFHTLDPDLAALLSPNKIAGGNGSQSGSTERLPLSASPAMRIQRISDEGLSRSTSPNLLSASSRSKGSPVPPPDNLPLLAESPQLSQSKRVFSSAKPHSLTHIPRPSTSSSSASTLSPSSTKSRFPRFNAPGPGESNSVDVVTPDRRPSASPSMLQPSLSPTDLEEQTPAMNRTSTDRRPGSKLGLNTPLKTSTLHNPPSSRPALRQLSTQNEPWNSETVSLSSRAPSSMGITGRRQFGPRPSLDSARPSFERLDRLERPSPQSQSLAQGRVRGRNRSMSESTGSPESRLSNQPNSGSLHRRAIDFTGPRTARLFREAGLLPKDRDRERDRDEESSSRQTSPVYSRSSMDRERVADYHRQMAPSRTGYSEISATSSTWGRARATPSVVSERVGTPFTSSSSTAPTSATSSLPPLSISSALQQQREDASAYQVLREKHQMETEALLSALSDSQNLSKVLREENVRVREENSRLRERLEVLEETIEVMRRERERERERLNDSRPHSRNHPVYGSSSGPRMSRFASSEHVGMARTVSSLEGVYKRSYAPTAPRPQTSYHCDEFGSNVFPHNGRSRAGSRLGIGSTLGSELDLISPESSPGEVVGHRRISPDHQETFMDDHLTLPTSHTRNGFDHRDRAHSIAGGFGLGNGHPSRRFEAGMEKAKTKGMSGLGIGGGAGGRRVVSDTLSQRSLPSSRPHSRPDDDEDETQHGFRQPSRRSSGHLRTHSAASSIFRVPPSNMSLLMHSSPNSDDEGLLDADSTRRDIRPEISQTFVFKKTQAQTQVSVGNVPDISPTTVNFSMSQPGSPGSLRLRSDHEDHLGDMESVHFDGESDHDGLS